MTIVELKEKLIENIRNTGNEKILKHISDIFEFEYNADGVYKMSPEEIEAVKEGREQIKNGQWLSHEEANSQIDELLKSCE